MNAKRRKKKKKTKPDSKRNIPPKPKKGVHLMGVIMVNTLDAETMDALLKKARILGGFLRRMTPKKALFMSGVQPYIEQELKRLAENYNIVGPQ